MKWYDSNWVCQTAIPNCAVKANLTGCSQCDGNGTLAGTSPESCIPPVCTPPQTLAADWICRDPVTVSSDPLTFSVTQSFTPESLQLSDLAVIVELRQQDGQLLAQNHIQQNILNLRILSVTPADLFSKITFSQESVSRLLINLDFVSEPTQSSIELVFRPDQTSFSATFALVDKEQTLTVQVTKKVSAESLESDKQTAATIAKVNSVATAGAEVASLGLSFLSIDPTGHLMKLGQMQKTYCRFRFPDINHGAYLSNYFQHSAASFDPPTNKTSDEVVLLNKSQRPSMIKYRIAFDVFEVQFLKVVIFSASWCLKLLAFWILSAAVRSRSVSKLSCYFVAFSQKLHMVSLNTVALDVIPYSLRALFETTERLPLLTRVFSGLLTSLLIFDFCEIYSLGGRAEVQSYEQVSKKGEKDNKDKLDK